MTESVKQSHILNINDSIDAAIFFCSSIQAKTFRCPECDQPAHLNELKAIKRQGKSGWTLRYLGDCSHRWSITLFPMGTQALEGQVTYKGEAYEVVVLRPAEEEPQKEMQ